MSTPVRVARDEPVDEAPPNGGASRRGGAAPAMRAGRVAFEVHPDGAHPIAPPPAPSAARPRRSLVRTLALLIGPPVLIVLLVMFVAEPFRIPTPSMEPTLRPGDHVLVNKLAYRLGEPRRDDLAVFRAPDTGEISLKRIVGLPGDRVGIADGVLTVNGLLRRERYVDYRFTDSVYFGPITVPRGHVFVMGDNRSDSVDSRDYGAVPERDLMGRVALRLWPLNR